MKRPARMTCPPILGLILIAAKLGAAPTVSISSPVGQTLSNTYQSQGGSDNVTVTGSVGGTNLKSWTLQYRLSPSGGWTVIATGTTAVTGNLGVWSTLDRPDGTFNVNGVYNLQLFACDTSNVCTYTTTVNDTISNFSLTQSTPSGSPEINVVQKITYKSVLPFSLNVTLTIKDIGGNPIFSVGTSQSGTWDYEWNGTKTGGTRAPDGPYFVTAAVSNGLYTLNWDETSLFLGGPPAFAYVTDPYFDPFNNDPLPVSYNFPVGRVTIAVAPTPPSGTEIPSTCSPPSFCLLDHKYEESGPHTLKWAGVDPTGKFRRDVGMMAILSERTAFSKNAVVLYGTKPKVDNVTVTPPVAWSGASQAIVFDVTGPTPISTRQIKIRNQESLTDLRTITVAAGLCTFGGTHCSALWDGKADNGMLVAPGGYTITVTATDNLQNVASSQALAFRQE